MRQVLDETNSVRVAEKFIKEKYNLNVDWHIILILCSFFSPCTREKDSKHLSFILKTVSDQFWGLQILISLSQICVKDTYWIFVISYDHNLSHKRYITINLSKIKTRYSDFVLDFLQVLSATKIMLSINVCLASYLCRFRFWGYENQFDETLFFN